MPHDYCLMQAEYKELVCDVKFRIDLWLLYLLPKVEALPYTTLLSLTNLLQSKTATEVANACNSENDDSNSTEYIRSLYGFKLRTVDVAENVHHRCYEPG